MQGSSQIITTNKPTPSFFTGRMPFLSHRHTTDNVKALKGKYHPWTCLPQAHLGSSNFVSDHFDLLVFYFQLQKVVGKSRFPSVNYCIEMWVYTSNPGVLYGSFSNLTGFESMSHQICCFCQIGLNVINSQHYSLQYIVHDILSLSCSRMHYDDKQQPAHLMALN